MRSQGESSIDKSHYLHLVAEDVSMVMALRFTDSQPLCIQHENGLSAKVRWGEMEGGDASAAEHYLKYH